MDLTDHALSNTVSALKQGSRVSLQHESRAVQGLLLVLRRQLALYSTTISVFPALFDAVCARYYSVIVTRRTLVFC
eukprot:m.429337 g.429337  ORF g.429337 m.429337 type:complete len:76 (+) comp56714_c0_seq38:1243-1470(+)